MANPVNWFEIVGGDAARMRRLYSELFGWKIDANNPMQYGIVTAEDGASAAASVPPRKGRLDT